MPHKNWDYCEIWFQKRKYQILTPKNVSQLWIVHDLLNPGIGVEIDFWGNRSGLEAVQDACAVLSETNNFLVYLPCKRNPQYYLGNFLGIDQIQPSDSEFLDMVFLKPNGLKINDWKEIRSRIPKTIKKNFRCNMKIKKKDTCCYYKKDTLKVVYRFDTLFFNCPRFLYPSLAAETKTFLDSNLEKTFFEDVKTNNHRLRAEDYLWCLSISPCEIFETGVFFWDNDIYQQAQLRRQL